MLGVSIVAQLSNARDRVIRALANTEAVNIETILGLAEPHLRLFPFDVSETVREEIERAWTDCSSKTPSTNPQALLATFKTTLKNNLDALVKKAENHNADLGSVNMPVYFWGKSQHNVSHIFSFYLPAAASTLRETIQALCNIPDSKAERGLHQCSDADSLSGTIKIDKDRQLTSTWLKGKKLIFIPESHQQARVQAIIDAALKESKAAAALIGKTDVGSTTIAIGGATTAKPPATNATSATSSAAPTTAPAKATL